MLMHVRPLCIHLSLYQKSLDNKSIRKPNFCSLSLILRFDLKVKGHMGQGQRSHELRSNEGFKQIQVGSRQRQVASLYHLMYTLF